MALDEYVDMVEVLELEVLVIELIVFQILQLEYVKQNQFLLEILMKQLLHVYFPIHQYSI
jgi:hypothetical protein